MREKIPFIVFEGPDMCGKSTHIDSVVNELNKITGKNFKAFKFPVYSGFKGPQILYHLKTFDINSVKKTKSKSTDIHNILVELTDHAINLMINKIDAYIECVNESSDCDGFIVDRFDLSQYIYDIAWCNFFSKDKKHIKRRDIRKFFYEAGYRAFVTNEYFSQKFDIKYVIFKQSKIIKTLAFSDKNRRIDKYDMNFSYQNYISNLFKFFTNNKRHTFIESVCDMDNSEFTIINVLIICLKRLFNPLFDCLTDKNNHVMHNIYNNIKESVICTIDTDDMYTSVLFEEKCLKFLNYTDVDTVKELVSKYKDSVTSNIDNEIINKIIKYLEDDNGR